VLEEKREDSSLTVYHNASLSLGRGREAERGTQERERSGGSIAHTQAT